MGKSRYLPPNDRKTEPGAATFSDCFPADRVFMRIQSPVAVIIHLFRHLRTAGFGGARLPRLLNPG